jgi:uncharacterized protein YceK
VYGGVLHDLEKEAELAEETIKYPERIGHLAGMAILLAVDLPLCVVGDTVTLPFILHRRINAQGEHEQDRSRVTPRAELLPRPPVTQAATADLPALKREGQGLAPAVREDPTNPK